MSNGVKLEAGKERQGNSFKAAKSTYQSHELAWLTTWVQCI